MKRLSALWLSLVLLIPVLSGQSLTSMGGTVTDPTGAVIPAAQIIVENVDTGGRRETAADAAGRYSVPQVLPGRYRITAKAAGFRDVIVGGVQLQVNSPATVNIQFEKLGTVAEAVSVSAEAVQVNTTDASIGNAIGTKPIMELPMFARNVVTLLALQPGVTYFGGGGDSQINGSVNGGRVDQSNITLDGVDVNDQEEKKAFTSVLRVTLDSVQEFRTTTSNANADQGRTSGAQVALVTKSGTNDMHGSAYQYHRNTAGAANSFFNNLSGVAKPKLLINVFGASVGGPVRKNRTFYFLNYEGRRDASAASSVRTVPTNNMRQGIVRYIRKDGSIGEVGPADLKTRYDPLGIGVSQKVLEAFRLYPEANDMSTGDGLNVAGFRFTSPQRSKQDTYISRLDHVLDTANRHTLFLRGNLQNDHAPSAPWFPTDPPQSVSLNNSKGLAAGYNAVLRPNLISTFRYGYTRRGNESTGVQNQSMVGFRQYNNRYATTTGQTQILPVHTISEDLAWNRGAHNIQFGAVVHAVRIARASFANSFNSAQTDVTNLKGTGGEFMDATPDIDPKTRANFGNAIAAVLGLVSQAESRYNYDKQGNVLPPGSPARRLFVSQDYEFYMQDTWRVNRALTVTGGLRYSLMPPFHEANGEQISALPVLGDWYYRRGELANAGRSQTEAGLIRYVLRDSPEGSPLYPFHKKNLAPRLSLAYSPQGSSGLSKFFFGGPGRSSIRAGWGMFYDLFGSGLMIRSDARAMGFSTRLTTKGGTYTTATSPRFNGIFSMPAELIRPAPAGGFPQTPDPLGGQATTAVPDAHLKPPYSMNMNLSLGREFGGGFYIQGSYVSRLSRRAFVASDVALATNLKDPESGMTYFQASQQLANLIRAKTPVGSVPKISFWENMWPAAAGKGLTATQNLFNFYQKWGWADWADATDVLDTQCDPWCSRLGKYALFNGQYYALPTFQSIANANYHAMQWTVRKRFGQGVLLDFNYTWSKSIDLRSSPERASLQAASNLLLNTWMPRQMRGVSDYDVTQMWNSGWVVELPFGRGKRLLSGAGRGLDALVGGWQLSGLWFQTTELPAGVNNGYNWPTNWNVNGWATPVSAVPAAKKTKNAPAVAGKGGPNLFADPKAALAAYDYTLPGESGQRNGLRSDGYMNVDMGLGKRVALPYAEHHSLQFRWEVFNVFNTIRFDGLSTGLESPGSFGKFSGQRTSPRQMQFGLRYEF